MSQHAAQIARLTEEARKLEARAYTLTTQLSDRKLNDEGRALLGKQLAEVEAEHVDKHREIGQLRLASEKQAELAKQQLPLF